MRVVGGTNRASVESSYRTRKRERERRREKPLVFSSVEVLTRSTKSVDGAVEDELGSVDARFGGTTSLRHSPLQLRHGLVAAHLPLPHTRFEGGLGAGLDYTSQHTPTLTLRLLRLLCLLCLLCSLCSLVSTLPAVRDEGAGEGVDEGVDGLPESAERAEDEDGEHV